MSGRNATSSTDARGPGSVPPPGSPTLRSALLVAGTIGAVVGAGFAAWQHRRESATPDPWVIATAPRTGLLAAVDDGRPADAEPPSPGAP